MSFLTICELKPFISTAFSFSNVLRQSPAIIQVRNYAARKGTREKRRKAKVKVEIVKEAFVPHGLRKKEKLLANRPKLKFDDSLKPDPTDNVYPLKYYKWPVYPFVEAVKCHRETHHPEMYNQTNAKLQVIIELNTEAEKKNKYIDNFTKIVGIPYPYDHGEERTVIAFSKDSSHHDIAREKGVQMYGGPELIKQIQNGDISLQDFQFVLAHPNILPELVSLRGLMKKKFPNPKHGTLDVNFDSMVHKFLTGVQYTAKKDDYEKDFGLIQTVIGTLNMDPTYLEANFAALVKDVWLAKPRNKKDFIRRCLLMSPPSSEKLKVDHTIHVLQNSEKDDDDEDTAEVLEVKV